MDIKDFSEEAFNAYLAGFTDGEGHLTKPGVEGVRITLANCVPGVLENMRDRLGFGVIRSQKQQSHWARKYTLQIGSMQGAKVFLGRTLPYLVIKRDAALAMLEKIEAHEKRVKATEARNNSIRAQAEAGRMRTAIARDFGISPQLVSKIMRGHTWPSERSQIARRRQRNAQGLFLPQPHAGDIPASSRPSK